MEKLTPKREKFAQCVASGLDQSASYRAAFDAGRMKPSSVNVNASKLMADTKVRQRVAELRQPIVAAVGITLESHLAELERLRNRADELDQVSAAITAEIARGKASGVVAPERREHSGPHGGPIQTRELSLADRAARIAALLANAAPPKIEDDGGDGL